MSSSLGRTLIVPSCTVASSSRQTIQIQAHIQAYAGRRTYTDLYATQVDRDVESREAGQKQIETWTDGQTNVTPQYATRTLRLVNSRRTPRSARHSHRQAGPQGQTPTDFAIPPSAPNFGKKPLQRQGPLTVASLKAQIEETKALRRHKAVTPSETIDHDPIKVVNVAESVERLREYLHTKDGVAYTQHSGSEGERTDRVDPYSFLKICQLFRPRRLKGSRRIRENTKLKALEPYITDIYAQLVPHFTTTSMDQIETPEVCYGVVEVLGMCLIRAGLQSTSPTVEEIMAGSKGIFAELCDQYAQVIIHQAIPSLSDQERMDALLAIHEVIMDEYSYFGRFSIPVPLVAALMYLRDAAGKEAGPANTFIWPSVKIVADYLRPLLEARGVNTDNLEDKVRAMYSVAPPIILPPTVADLDRFLLSAQRRGDETAMLTAWAQYRDSLNTEEPEDKITSYSELFIPERRVDVLSSFYHRLTSRHFTSKKKPSRMPMNVDEAAEQVLSHIPKPYPIQVLHALMAKNTRIRTKESGASATGNDPEEELVQDDVMKDISVPILPKDQGDDMLKKIKAVWSIAHEPGAQRDSKLYMLYILALGRLEQAQDIQDAWNALIADEQCQELHRKEHGNASYPPATVFNQVLASLTKNPKGEGVEAALRLFNQACRPDSAITVDLYSFNVILQHWAASGNIVEMQKLVERATALGFSPNGVTFGILIQGFFKGDNLRLVKETLEIMRDNNIQPTERLLPSIVSGWVKLGEKERIRDAETLIAETKASGVPINIFTWAALIGGYFRGGWEKDGWHAIKRMEAEGVKMNNNAYNTILMEAGKKVEEGGAPGALSLEIFKKMLDDGIYPGSKTYVKVLLPLIKTQQWEQADEVVKAMQKMRFAPEKNDLKKLLFHIQWRREWRERGK